MEFKRSFAAGFALGILVTVSTGVVLVVWAKHSIRQSTRTDLLVSEIPQPTFPNSSQRQIYGTPDPNWSFRSTDGKSVKLANFRGRVVFVHFWATWCGGCREELGYIRWLQDRVRNLPVSIVLLSEENPEKVKKYLSGVRFGSLPSYVATDKTPSVFQIFELPTTFIIDRDGRVVYRYVGAAPWGDQCVKFLSELASERVRETNTTAKAN